jgi:DMSO reductase family type II enzyme molybdopterin subunit
MQNNNYGFTRRDFIKGAGLGVLSLSLSTLSFRGGKAFAQDPPKTYPYRSWEDLYKKQWTWDKVAKVTHPRNCWYQAHCSWDALIKDGIVVREEQSADYPQTRPELSDFNPRGCQKGACYSARMYDPTRIKYPLKRVGERGEGKWQRISWDQALTEIADTMIDIISQEGPDTFLYDVGTNLSLGPQGLGLFRLCVLLDSGVLDCNPEIGDDHQGMAVTAGSMIGCGSADNWFYTDIFLIWAGNPSYTGMPYSHFLWEARYNGTRVIGISPDYNPSVIHCDQWIPINIGTDAALALGMARIIVQEGLYNKEFIKEQTDMPFLVRDDTKRFLREKDLKENGRDDIFYLFDLKTQKIQESPRSTLTLGNLDPALEGNFEVETLQGKVKVRPVFEFLKDKLKDYSLDKVSKITGINPTIIEKLARDIAKARTVTNMTNSCVTKFYHGDLIERSQILLLALCGHFGKKGSGFNAFPMLIDDTNFRLAFAPPLPFKEALAAFEKSFAERVKEIRQTDFTDEMLSYEFARKIEEGGITVSNTLFWYVHGGLNELSGRSKEWDKYLKREVDEYVKESLEKGWQRVFPPPGKEPRILFECGGNIIRRVRGYTALLKTLWPKLRLIVTLDFRMSSTGLHSDYVLPAAGYYEKNDFAGWIGPYQPFFQVTTKAVDPLYEAKSEWEIHCLLAKKIQERAKQRNILTFKDKQGKERRFDTLYDDLTYGKYYTEKDDEKVCQESLALSPCFKGDWNHLKGKGWVKWEDIGKGFFGIGNATDIKPDEPIVPYTWHTDKKIPWPTLTRRMQFYIDQDFYLECGEELPIHKDPPITGGNYPLTVTGGHARWSIHSMWRDETHMLRLQRGQPIMYMSVADAQKRKIKDGEIVLVKNAVDSFEIMAKVSPAIRPGQVVIYHAWEQYQFKGHKLFQNLMPSPIKPTELAGDYFHLRPFFGQLSPGQSDRDTRVEVIKIT